MTLSPLRKNEGVGQIAQVIQNNSSTSEEAVSAAQELTNQSDMLKRMVDVLSLGNNKRN